MEKYRKTWRPVPVRRNRGILRSLLLLLLSLSSSPCHYYCCRCCHPPLLLITFSHFPAAIFRSFASHWRCLVRHGRYKGCSGSGIKAAHVCDHCWCGTGRLLRHARTWCWWRKVHKNKQTNKQNKNKEKAVPESSFTKFSCSNRTLVAFALGLSEGAFFWVYSGIGIAGMIRIILPFQAWVDYTHVRTS